MIAAPTTAELARAAELAPRVAALLPSLEWQTFEEPHEVELLVGNPKDCLSMEGLLHPSVFQAVLLALPQMVAVSLEDAIDHKWFTWKGEPLSRLQWLLTPAGMLAFYEALVALEVGA